MKIFVKQKLFTFLANIKNLFSRPQEKQRTRRRLYFLLLSTLVVIFFALCLPVNHASAQGVIGSLVKKIPGGIAGKITGIYAGVTILLAVILGLCHVLVAMAASLLEGMLKPDTYVYLFGEKFTPFLQDGWVIVRDVCNLFFLLALLFIAFCTILRIEKYHAKKTLLTLIIMALLINFSKPITVFIFDGSQLLMNYFMTNQGMSLQSVITGSGLSDLGKMFSRDLGGSLIIDWVNPVSYMLSIVIVWIYAIGLFCIAAILVIRVVAIYILIIVSPLAFLLAVIPDFSGYSTKWWAALFRYSYVGPVMAFFLFLALKLAKVWEGIKQANPNLQGGFHIVSLTFSPKNEFQKLLPMFIIIVFLYAALLVSQQFGIEFAGAIVSRGRRIMNWGARNLSGYRIAKWGAKTGIKRIDREVLAKERKLPTWGILGRYAGKGVSLSPRVWKEAWEKHTKEREADVYDDAHAVVMERLSETFKAGRKIPEFYTRKREAERIAKYEKEQNLMGTAPEIVLKEMAKLYQNKGTMDPREVQDRALAYIRTLFNSRDFNEARKMKFLKMIGMNKPMDAGKAPDYVRQIMGTFGITSDKDQLYHAKRFGEMGLAHDDSHLWALEVTNPKVRNKMLFGKMGTIAEKKFSAGMHTEAIHIKDDGGNVVGISGTADPYLRRWKSMGYTFLHEMRTQVKSDTLSEEGIKAHHARYNALLAEAKTLDSRAKAETSSMRRGLLENAAAARKQSAQDEYDWVAAVATQGSKNWTPAQIQENLDRIKAATGEKWDMKTIDELKEAAKDARRGIVDRPTDTETPPVDDDTVTGD